MTSTTRPSASNKETNVANVLDELAEKIHRRSLVLIFSDMFDSAEDADNLFKSLQHSEAQQA